MNTSQPTKNSRETATFGGGCFWCTEAVFNEVRGVEKVESGYSGGNLENPSYEDVCTGTTGHAEVAQVTFDPKVVSFKELVRVFFTVHDPTSLNRQGADVGTQYRSAIFFHNDEQRNGAEEVIKEFEASKAWRNRIVTEVSPFKSFYRAEDYHQKYFEKNQRSPYCQVVIEPKIAKLRKYYQGKLKR